MVDMINQKRKYFAEQKAKARRNKPMTQVEQRTYMSTYLKNQGTWKLTQLKKLTFAELKEEFEKLTPKKQKIDDKDVPVTEEKVEGVKKKEPVKRIGKRKKQIARKGISVDKTAQDETKEMEAYMIDKVIDPSSGSDIRIDAIPTATKPPSILYRLVIEKYGANRSEEMYDKVLWSDLKTMFDPPLSASTIYMLADRKYPLSKDACQAMLNMKLQGGAKDEVCYQLLKMIKKQTSRTGYSKANGFGKDFSNPLMVDSLPKTVCCEKQRRIIAAKVLKSTRIIKSDPRTIIEFKLIKKQIKEVFWIQSSKAQTEES
ncbi:hypothetical protein Tco_1005096 [Tanacetum coccineum]|uniref:Uncharacterized protein n=1 Tax=Tanacetum coccineum TaxID=301880 RepID=A0ABQ5FF62_9ASTR